MQEEIGIGEHVRTEEGIIQKCTDVDNSYVYADDVLSYNFQGDIEIPNSYVEKTRIVKHSKNIIDLIEVGDILKVHLPNTQKTITVIVDEYFEDSMVLKGIQNKNVFLKAIVTSEQFESIEYKI